MPHKEDSHASAELRRVVRDEIRSVMAWQMLKKNGDTWAGWLGKLITPDRIIWAIALIFMFGSRVEKYTTGVDTITSDQKDIKAAQILFKDDLEKYRVLLMQHDELLRKEAEDRKIAPTRQDIAKQLTDLSDRVSQGVTRNELRQILVKEIYPKFESLEEKP